MTATSASPPASLRTLVERFDPAVFDLGRGHARVRLQGAGVGRWDVLLRDRGAVLAEADPRRRPDAVLTADGPTWLSLAEDVRGGMEAFRAGRLVVRRDLHLGVGFLAATAASRGEGALRFRRVATRAGRLSVMEAGAGPPVVLLHGLGATKASFLPTVGALADRHRVVAVDLPGFGDSDKPLGAPYDAPFFAGAVVALLDALGLERAAIAGNSMGGRVALETALRASQRVERLVLLAPALAWLRDRPWAPLLRLVPPQLGVLQPAPRALVEPVVRRVIPGAEEGWTAAGVDEFLRSFLEPRGRAAFYAAARSIYLDEPHGPGGFWTRLGALTTESLFVWGRRDRLVPVAFARHVRRVVPHARHLELDCGHVPQLERPHVVHDAMARFLAGQP
ncbi:MAG TPA: alpha/beta fold hydrolase [Solirubrobacteraceae bacterium]|nr:alpha/beta fold hydrolase [Solirubrobacteraceae bacterium]